MSQLSCKYLDSCGACDLGTKSMAEQLKAKSSTLSKRFGRDVPIHPSPLEVAYRSRALLRGRVENGLLKLGYFAKGSRDFVAIDHCTICCPEINNLIETWHGKPTSLREDLRFRILLQLSASEMKAHLHVVNAKDNDVNLLKDLLAKDTQISFAEDLSFQQCNEGVNALIRDRIAQLAKAHEPKSILDLYCGNGNLTRDLPVEVDTHVFADENRYAMAELKSHISHEPKVELYCNSAKDVCASFLKSKRSFDFVVVDPARRGLDELAYELGNLCSAMLLYVSCNPSSFQKDWSILSRHFELESLEAYDMFAQSSHAECFAVLRKKPDELSSSTKYQTCN